MERLREEFNSDWQMLVENPTLYRTEQNKYKVRCDLCKRNFFADKGIYTQVMHSVEFDPSNNPFVCDDCLDEIKALSYGGR